MTMRDRFIRIRDGAVTFRVLSDGEGPPLVYFHSFHERGAWSPFLAELARQRTVLAPLHPGVGGSEGIETLEDVFDLTLAYDELLTALGLATVDLCGHFFGGMMAAEVAAVFSQRARTLALISPLGLWRDDAPSEDILILPPEELVPVLWRDSTSAAARQWGELPETDEANIAAQIESIGRRSAMAKFVWPLPDKGLKKRLHRIRASTLLLWGDADRANPIVYAAEWQRRIKGAAVKVLPGGHMLIHEDPAAAAAAIVEHSEAA